MVICGGGGCRGAGEGVQGEGAGGCRPVDWNARHLPRSVEASLEASAPPPRNVNSGRITTWAGRAQKGKHRDTALVGTVRSQTAAPRLRGRERVCSMGLRARARPGVRLQLRRVYVWIESHVTRHEKCQCYRLMI